MTQILPVTRSIVSAQALRDLILPRYVIGTVTACIFHTLGVNDAYEVRTLDGNKYFLRVYRAGYRNLAEVAFEVDALNHLHRNGFSAAHPLADANGHYIHTLTAPEGERYAVLFTWAYGAAPSYDEDTEHRAHEYGRAVAALHNAGDGFNSIHPRFHLDVDLLVRTSLTSVQPFLAHRPSDWDYLQRFADDLCQRVEVLPASALDRGLCHGDTQGYHHHTTPDGVMTFFDFDFCGMGVRAYDIAIFRWCARLGDKEKLWWQPFLNGYQEARSLREADVAAIPLFVCARYIWHMGLHTANAYDWGHAWLNDEYFDKGMQNLRKCATDYFTP
jgi:Ser/Thr protein kinase RdoA (MazF antagonist)